MAGNIPSALRASRRSPIAVSVASLFALAAPVSAIADTWIVDSCDESSHSTPGVNHGTLRYALLNATDPATIDMTGLTGPNACLNSKISLSTGELVASMATLTIDGPGSNVLQIDASAMEAGSPSVYGDYRVLAHYGAGKLAINNLGLAHGHTAHYNFPGTSGGCVFSNADVELNNVSVTSCYTYRVGNSYPALGGGVYTKGALTLSNSTVSGSHAVSAQTQLARGGGVYAKGNVTTTASSIDDNYATSAAANARGGGLYTAGNASLTSSFVSNNKVTSNGGGAIGGGMYVRGNAILHNARVRYNSASATGPALGGGAYVVGDFNIFYSQIYQNKLTGSGSYGGGAQTLGNFLSSYSTVRDNTAGVGGGLSLFSQYVSINATTISGNVSEVAVAGINVSSGASGILFVISNSTISGNKSSHSFGGLFVDSPTAKFYNTTIAFNTSVGYFSYPGVALSPQSINGLQVTLQSTLMSNNTYGTPSHGDKEYDFGIFGPGLVAFNGGDLATPANNLIRKPSVSYAKFPADTKFASCPNLGRLRDNGGLTQTHALLSHSPAINNDHSPLGLFLYDQRGPSDANGTLDYPRISGPLNTVGTGLTPDIGAYEVQQNDIIFDTDFEACLP